MSIKGKILGGVLRFLGRKLDGKKTYLGAAGKILTGFTGIATGIVGIIGIMYPDFGFPVMDIEISLASISGGFYAISSGFQGIGIGHKIEKSKRLVDQQEEYY
jgi:hypothetical protein